MPTHKLDKASHRMGNLCRDSIHFSLQTFVAECRKRSHWEYPGTEERLPQESHLARVGSILVRVGSCDFADRPCFSRQESRSTKSHEGFASKVRTEVESHARMVLNLRSRCKHKASGVSPRKAMISLRSPRMRAKAKYPKVCRPLSRAENLARAYPGACACFPGCTDFEAKPRPN